MLANNLEINNNTLVVLGTGGTIAGRSDRATDNVAYTAGQVPVEELLGSVPVPVGCVVEAEQLEQVDSKDMGPRVWKRLLERLVYHLGRPEVKGIVVTHGTDTLEETAFLLQAVLNPLKPVVLVSAMRPATALVPDGPQNLLDALTVAACPQSQGVLAVCAGKIHLGMVVQKVHPYRLDAFDSGEAGPIGVVEEGRVRWLSGCTHAAMPGQAEKLRRLLAANAWPRVEWLTSHGGADGAIVHALLDQRQQTVRLKGAQAPEVLRGIVLAGTGNGTVHACLLTALLHAQASGVAVWVTTRCTQGRVVPATNERLPTTGWPPAKARLALMLELI